MQWWLLSYYFILDTDQGDSCGPSSEISQPDESNTYQAEKRKRASNPKVGVLVLIILLIDKLCRFDSAYFWWVLHEKFFFWSCALGSSIYSMSMNADFYAILLLMSINLYKAIKQSCKSLACLNRSSGEHPSNYSHCAQTFKSKEK